MTFLESFIYATKSGKTEFVTVCSRDLHRMYFQCLQNLHVYRMSHFGFYYYILFFLEIILHGVEMYGPNRIFVLGFALSPSPLTPFQRKSKNMENLVSVFSLSCIKCRKFIAFGCTWIEIYINEKNSSERAQKTSLD